MRNRNGRFFGFFPRAQVIKRTGGYVVRRPTSASDRVVIEGVHVVPSNMSPDEISAMMRMGRAKMIEECGAEAVAQANRSIVDHVAHVERRGVRA